MKKKGKENGGGGGGGGGKPEPMDVDGPGGGSGKGKGKAPKAAAAKVGRKRKLADGDEEYEGEDDDEEGENEEEGEGEDEEFVGIESTLIELIKKFVPDAGHGKLSKRDAEGNRLPGTEPFFYAQKKAELIAAVQALELPQFPLDDLITKLGALSVVVMGWCVTTGYVVDGSLGWCVISGFCRFDQRQQLGRQLPCMLFYPNPSPTPTPTPHRRPRPSRGDHGAEVPAGARRGREPGGGEPRQSPGLHAEACQPQRDGGLPARRQARLHHLRGWLDGHLAARGPPRGQPAVSE